MAQAPNNDQPEFIMEVSPTKQKEKEVVDLSKEELQYYHQNPIPKPKPKPSENLTQEEQIQEASQQCQYWWNKYKSLENIKEFMQLQQRLDSLWTPIDGDIIDEIFYDDKWKRWKTMVKRIGGPKLFINNQYNNEIRQYLKKEREKADKNFDIWSLWWGILHGKNENWKELKELMGKSEND